MSKTEDGKRKTERLDVAIDRTVREMLDVEPQADLRARVITRIDALSPDRVASAFLGAEALAKAARRKIVWVAAPLAAAAVIILVVLAPWRQPAPSVVAPVSP